jgi:hypothetical protein
VPRTVKGGVAARVEPTEREFMQQVFGIARDFGWSVYHPHLSKFGASGWPDLVLVKPPQLLFAELKTGSNKPTPSQQRWLDLLRAVPSVEVYLWRPSDMQHIAEVLSRGKP